MSKKSRPIRVKLIVNPGAGKTADTDSNLKLVTGYLEKNGLKVNSALAKPKGAATRIARRAIKNGYKIVIAMGGDATIKAVMRGMIGSKARLGIVPTGTENNIAVSLGISLNLEEACVMIASDNTLKLDVGQVKTRKGKKFVFFEMATIGLSAAIHPDVNKAAGGKLSGAMGSAIAHLHRETGAKVFLTLNDKNKIEVETMLVTVSNTPVFGKNSAVTPGASLQDGLLDISVYPGFSNDELLRYYAAVMDKGYSDDEKVQHYQARKLKVKTSPKLDVMADGVALGRGTVTIKSRPGALRIISSMKNSGLESPQKDAAVLLTEPVSPTAGKNHGKERAISMG